MTRPVFLLKSPSRLADDPYQKLFEAEGYYPVFVEVLESVFSNETRLQDIISSDPRGVYRGVVITSSRSAEAWQTALERILDCGLYGEPVSWKYWDLWSGNWLDIPFYVVGESTAHALEPMTNSHPANFSKLLILGAHTGKAESLARFVLDDLPTRHTVGRLLYLTGDKNRDTFCRIMSEHDVPIESLMVYETRAANDLEDRIHCAVQKADNSESFVVTCIYQPFSWRKKKKKLSWDCGKHANSVWISFFASSSSGFALPYLKQHFSLPHAGSSDESIIQESTLKSARLAAIGTTTFEFLTGQAHLKVDALPAKPSAEHLVASIKSFDEKQRNASLWTAWASIISLFYVKRTFCHWTAL